MTPTYLRAARIGALLLTFSSASSNAAIVGGSARSGSAALSGGVFDTLALPLPNPSGEPDSVGINNFDSNNFFGFDEAQNIVLTQALEVDLLASTLAPGNLASGTSVASHYLFFDPGPSQRMVATVEFDATVLGVITSTANLAASDFLANTGVDYLSHRLRGLEAGDLVAITGAQQIAIDFQASSPGDYIRVLTALPPGAAPGSTSETDPPSGPIAVDDRASTAQGQRVLIDVLANDRGLNDTPISLELVSVPIDSRAFVRSEFVQGDNQVAFYPAPDFYGEQTLIYQITDADGNTATGNVVVDVACTGCTETPSITLSWSPVPGNVNGYRVFVGDTAGTATNLVAEVTSSSVTFNAGTNLGLRIGDRVCFRVKAYNDQGESDFSDAVCATLSAPPPPAGQQPEAPSSSGQPAVPASATETSAPSAPLPIDELDSNLEGQRALDACINR